MQAILAYLKTHKLAWILPIVVFLVVLLIIAWKISQTPVDPFAYRDV